MHPSMCTSHATSFSAHSRLPLAGEAAQQIMHPGTTYSHCSGGQPLDILDLTHDQLTEFHRRHYHPSNAGFYTYGDMPLESHLASISEKVLRHFDAIEPVGRNETVHPRWVVPQRRKITCAPDPVGSERQTTVSVGFLLNDSADQYTGFVLRVGAAVHPSRDPPALRRRS